MIRKRDWVDHFQTSTLHIERYGSLSFFSRLSVSIKQRNPKPCIELIESGSELDTNTEEDEDLAEEYA